MTRWQRTALVSLAALLALFAGAARAQESWQPFTPPAGFTVELPASPAHSTQSLTSGSGEPFVMDQYVVDKGAAAFVVQTAVYPPSVDVSVPKRNLEGAIAGSSKELDGGKWQEQNWRSVQGASAVELFGVKGIYAMRQLYVMDGRRMIVLTYAGPSGSSRGGDATRFIQSLRLAR
jgi:hypothetical protein